jgi:hypothetical protein
MDFGVSDETVFLGMATAPDGKLVIYKEFYENGFSPSELASCFAGDPSPSVIARLNNKEVFDWSKEFQGKNCFYIADPSGKSYIMEINKKCPDVKINRAYTDKEFGFNSVRYYLEDREDGEPGLICLENCEKWWFEHSRLRFPAKHLLHNREFPDPSCKDHTVDSTRYGCSFKRIREMQRDYKERKKNRKGSRGFLI